MANPASKLALVAFLIAGTAGAQKPAETKPNDRMWSDIEWASSASALKLQLTVRKTGKDMEWTQETTASMTGGESRVDMLSEDEFTRLEKLRRALTEAEHEIAVAHGVYFVTPCPWPCVHAVFPEERPRFDDDFQFRGRFLLINFPLFPR